MAGLGPNARRKSLTRRNLELVAGLLAILALGIFGVPWGD